MARRARRLPARPAHRARLVARLAGAATLIVAVLAPLPVPAQGRDMDRGRALSQRNCADRMGATVAAAAPTCSLEGAELRCSDGRRFPVYASPWEGLGGRAPAPGPRGSPSLEDPNSVPGGGGPDGERLEGPDGLVCVTHRGHVHCNR